MSKKFDVVIGNPPYQEEVADTRARPIYPSFMDEAYDLADIVCLITPGRFLFNAGATSNKWNRKMLSDRHLKVIDYQMESSDYFANINIMGGVAITYRDRNKNFEPIDLFIPYWELESILSKVAFDLKIGNLSQIVYTSVSYQLSKVFHELNPEESKTLPRNRNMLTTNIFDKFPNLFTKDKSKDDFDYLSVIGRQNNKRVYRWVDKRFIKIVDNFDKWKVVLPNSNGSGAIGEVQSTPLIGQPQIEQPQIGHTQTFISVGAFETELEAYACMKYIKSKFARVLLGVLKITQHNPPGVWVKVPLQDFTEDSDIDWSVSISEIDQQLYKKYGLSEEEINFIETNVKELT